MPNPKDWGLQYRAGVAAPTASQIAAQRIPVAAAAQQAGTAYELEPVLDWENGPDLADVLGGIAAIEAAVAASQNDWSPTGWYAANLILVDPSTSLTITGLDSNTSRAIKYICNVSANTLTLANNSSSSLAANRMVGAAAVALAQNEVVQLIRDPVSARWRFVLR